MAVVEFPRELAERPFDGTPVYKAEDLTRSGDVAHILLNGQTYTLRITKAGKLILTK